MIDAPSTRTLDERLGALARTASEKMVTDERSSTSSASSPSRVSRPLSFSEYHASYGHSRNSLKAGGNAAVAVKRMPSKDKPEKTTSRSITSRRSVGHLGGIFGKNRPKAKKRGVSAAVAQAMGSVGNAWMTDDDSKVPERVLIYRLCSLGNTGPWGDGKLLDLARAHADDAGLRTEVLALLEQPWRSDPLRAKLVQQALQPTLEPSLLPPAALPPPRSNGGLSLALRQSRAWMALRALLSAGKLMRVVRAHCCTWGDVLVDGRGAVGETVLHLCCLLSSPQHRRIISILVPWLATKQTRNADGFEIPALDAPYLGQPYNGEVALHFAVIQQNFSLVQLLIEHGASVHPHASGDFLYSNINLYFGGTILGFAACLGNMEIVDFLMTNGADANAHDLGPCAGGKPLTIKGMQRCNSVLHCCVLHQQAEMYTHLMKTHHANPWTRNEEADTPLLLAARIRSSLMAQVAMDGVKQVPRRDTLVAHVRCSGFTLPPARCADSVGLRACDVCAVPAIRDRGRFALGARSATDGAGGGQAGAGQRAAVLASHVEAAGRQVGRVCPAHFLLVRHLQPALARFADALALHRQ